MAASAKMTVSTSNVTPSVKSKVADVPCVAEETLIAEPEPAAEADDGMKLCVLSMLTMGFRSDDRRVVTRADLVTVAMRGNHREMAAVFAIGCRAVATGKQGQAS
jgi:hypothetical protein